MTRKAVHQLQTIYLGLTADHAYLLLLSTYLCFRCQVADDSNLCSLNRNYSARLDKFAKFASFGEITIGTKQWEVGSFSQWQQLRWRVVKLMVFPETGNVKELVGLTQDLPTYRSSEIHFIHEWNDRLGLENSVPHCALIHVTTVEKNDVLILLPDLSHCLIQPGNSTKAFLFSGIIWATRWRSFVGLFKPGVKVVNVQDSQAKCTGWRGYKKQQSELPHVAPPESRTVLIFVWFFRCWYYLSSHLCHVMKDTFFYQSKKQARHRLCNFGIIAL